MSNFASGDPLDGRPLKTRLPRRLLMLCAILLVTAFAVVIATSPAAQPVVRLDTATTWLLSTERHAVGNTNALIDGPSPATTDWINVEVSDGDRTATRRRGHHVVVTDEQTHRATVVDTQTLVARSTSIGTGQVLDVAAGNPYLIDQGAGRGWRLNAKLRPISTAAFSVTGQIGDVQASGDSLWLTVPAERAVYRIDGGSVPHRVSDAFNPNQDPRIVPIDGGVLLLDVATSQFTRLHAESGRAEQCRTSMPIPAPVESFAASPDGTYAVAVAGAPAELFIINLDGERSIAPVGLDGARSSTEYGTPVVVQDPSAGDWVYLPRRDEVTFLRIRPQMTAPQTVHLDGAESDLDLSTDGNYVWANDANGPRAIALLRDQWRIVTKYARDGAGGSDPASSASIPERPDRSSSQPPTSHPRPTAAPESPSTSHTGPPPTSPPAPEGATPTTGMTSPTATGTTSPTATGTTGPASPTPTPTANGCSPWPTSITAPDSVTSDTMSIDVTVCVEPASGHQHWIVETEGDGQFYVKGRVQRSDTYAVSLSARIPQNASRKLYAMDVGPGAVERVRQAQETGAGISLPESDATQASNKVTIKPDVTPGPTYANTADITNFHDGDAVGRCEIIRGTADLAPTMTMLLVHQRAEADAQDRSYYFVHAGDGGKGNIGPTWSGMKWFGKATGQNYNLILLVMDADAAQAFWEAHQQEGGSFAASASLPPEQDAKVADQIFVRENSTTNNC